MSDTKSTLSEYLFGTSSPSLGVTIPHLAVISTIAILGWPFAKKQINKLSRPKSSHQSSRTLPPGSGSHRPIKDINSRSAMFNSPRSNGEPIEVEMRR